METYSPQISRIFINQKTEEITKKNELSQIYWGKFAAAELLFVVLFLRLNKLINLHHYSETYFWVKIFKPYLMKIKLFISYYYIGIYLLKVKNKSFRTRCEICSKLTINTPERRHWSHLVSLLLTLNIFHTLF